jgi:NADPH:quinone reductase-like Zn-dependent oxidoreductase
VQAIALNEPGTNLALTEIESPQPDAGELLVRIVASSINPIDVLVGTGRYPWGKYEYPVVPGYDFAGVVEDIGSRVTRFTRGDEVLGYWNARQYHRGSWAEYFTVSEAGFVVHKPSQVSFQEAAALPLAAVTAALTVDATAPLAGETALIVGAGGAIGGYAVQLAASAGATVIATAKPGHEQRLRSLGAAQTIDYTSEDVAAVVREQFPDGIAALIDLPNGKDEVARLAELVRDGGRVASACWGADVDALAARGVMATNVAANRCDPNVLLVVATLVEAGQLEVAYDELRALSEVPAAVKEIAGGVSRKTVIAVS